MKKKLWMTFGPILVALLLFSFILFGPSAIFGGVSEQAVRDSATSMNQTSLQGNILQKRAMEENYLPLFGSSELSRLSAFHPSVFLGKYEPTYKTYLMGRPGTQSLQHFLDANMLGDSLKGKKIVFILSPQWFKQDGVGNGGFGANFSPLQAYYFALQTEKPTPEIKYAAKRLLEFQVVKDDVILSHLLKNKLLPPNKKPANAKFFRKLGELKYKLLMRKDELTAKHIRKSKQEQIDKGIAKLPETLDFKTLDKLALQTAEKQTADVPFHIKRKVYRSKLKPNMKKLVKQAQKLRYDRSPEYVDLQLLLDTFKKQGADVLVINQPLNGEWIDYSGMDKPMIESYYRNSERIVKENGFRYLSLQSKQDKPYYMEDTSHVNWRSWVIVDKRLQAFLAAPKPNHYPKGLSISEVQKEYGNHNLPHIIEGKTK
ncbi:D-alanyl-lipoteichoic acid biosynthesis protein DltD [Listeria grayi]|uniref:Protein DltD n=1 Tax=Listeria grayi DSM 20601 TaxID=525367 RepID=D7UY85_LISGR|nr:D-alanyl-lipoteichoic acid biosynthesis protein DltD [Listeria grayi]EFI83872.1 DltD C-terminal domain protein [Listeria grayi DSM 20601]